jgi:mono/diheme cytochrome c family protein
MSRSFVLGVFDDEHYLLDAAREARQAGLTVVDVYAPYPVHGLDQALGWVPSRLSAVCLAGGVVGVLLAVWFQYWTSAVDWPLNVGGRPWNSWPAFIPVIFEMMVLLAGFGVAFAFFGVSRLFPGRRPALPYPGVTHDRFVLLVANGVVAGRRARQLYAANHAVDILEREESDWQAPPRPVVFRRWNIVLGVLLVISVALNWLLATDNRFRGTELLPNMVHSPAYDTFSKNPHLRAGATLQPPLPGTIARGERPFHYEATPTDALRAGNDLKSPLAANNPDILTQGKRLFENNCQMCHGSAGAGDGPLAQRGVPVVSLCTDKTRAMKDGQLFHVLTLGQGQNMAAYAAQLSEQERWLVIGYIRNLQKQGEKKGP